MGKRLVLLGSMILSVFLLVSCGKEVPQPTETVSEVSAEAALSEVAENTYPITLVDQSGREIVIAQEPKRVVSSYYITTSALLALGLEEELQGIEASPERRPLYKKCAPEILERTQVGSPKEFDLEACASIHPDLVILPMRAQSMVESLENLGIPVMIVNPESQEQVLEMISLIAKATGKEERGEELVNFIQEKTDFLNEKLAGCDRPPVYLGGNSGFLSTASKGMYQNHLISLAGGENVAGEIDDTYWVEISYEQILQWNPQVIVLASDAKYSMEEILNDVNLQDCQAIRDGKVYQIPSEIEAWDSPVPSGIFGGVYLASVLHPDVVTEEQYESMVEEYYELFYGFSYKEQ